MWHHVMCCMWHLFASGVCHLSSVICLPLVSVICHLVSVIRLPTSVICLSLVCLICHGICHLSASGVCHLFAFGVCHLSYGICHLSASGVSHLSSVIRVQVMERLLSISTDFWDNFVNIAVPHEDTVHAPGSESTAVTPDRHSEYAPLLSLTLRRGLSACCTHQYCTGL